MISRKTWWQSATVWLNGVAAAVEILNGVAPFITDPKVHGWIIAGVGITNVVVRVFKTNTPIAAPEPKKAA